MPFFGGMGQAMGGAMGMNRGRRPMPQKPMPQQQGIGPTMPQPQPQQQMIPKPQMQPMPPQQQQWNIPETINAPSGPGPLPTPMQGNMDMNDPRMAQGLARGIGPRNFDPNMMRQQMGQRMPMGRPFNGPV